MFFFFCFLLSCPVAREKHSDRMPRCLFNDWWLFYFLSRFHMLRWSFFVFLDPEEQVRHEQTVKEEARLYSRKSNRNNKQFFLKHINRRIVASFWLLIILAIRVPSVSTNRGTDVVCWLWPGRWLIFAQLNHPWSALNTTATAPYSPQLVISLSLAFF